jgi:hypothetical protein
MNKDVIYIDVEDDVTAIIGKIKNAKEKIVAVVPPKRSGALQSAVNLRLLNRMAKADKKQLVLITNNDALVALAANSQIPVAKNLQSKPEIAEVPALAIDDGDDIIDGADLPVGDHAARVAISDGTRTNGGRSDAIDGIDVDNEGNSVAPDVVSAAAPAYGSAAGARVAKKGKNGKGRVAIPNFDKFRKRLFVGIGAGVALIALLIWAFVFAPAATVIVTAATTPSPVSATVKLGGTAATDYKSGIVKSSSQSEQKNETVEFEATGKKDVGTKATGTVRFSTSDASTAINGATIPAGTQLTSSSGLVFTTDSSATISAQNYQNVQVNVTAADNGTNYNGATGAASGAPSRISATFVDATTGGTSKIATVVSQDDIDRANGQLIGKSADDEKKALTAKFKNGEKVIDSSFTVDRAAAVSSPAVNAEAASGKASLTIPTTYSVQAIASADLESYLNSSLESQLANKDDQKVYETGVSKAGLTNFRKDGDTLTVAVTSTGQIGPKINEDQIKDQVKGKIYGEVQSTLEQINGVQNVDVKFSFFWVRTVPNDTNKIHIQFKVQNG